MKDYMPASAARDIADSAVKFEEPDAHMERMQRDILIAVLRGLKSLRQAFPEDVATELASQLEALGYDVKAVRATTPSPLHEGRWDSYTYLEVRW